MNIIIPFISLFKLIQILSYKSLIYFRTSAANLLAPILNNLFLVYSSPRISATKVNAFNPSSAVAIPPAGFSPIWQLFFLLNSFGK